MQQLAYFYPQPYESHPNLTAHVRACSVLVSGATLYTRFARLLGNGSRTWLAVGELVLHTAVRCAPQARPYVALLRHAQRLFLVKKPAFGC